MSFAVERIAELAVDAPGEWKAKVSTSDEQYTDMLFSVYNAGGSEV